MRHLPEMEGNIPFLQRKVLTAISRCRTPALGGHIDYCLDCGREHPSYNSCGYTSSRSRNASRIARWSSKKRSGCPSHSASGIQSAPLASSPPPGTHTVKPASVAGLEADREGFGDDAAAVAALRVIEGAPGDGAGAGAQFPVFDLEPGLLVQFAQGAFQEVLLLVQVAAGQGQQPMPGKAAAQPEFLAE